ncbi:MAG: WecB/TagA/CpsF family glycosyltransferase [Planctomycetota bacterium]|nr:WecB/TagA/CpsF family glycosyltransferase [Planctomycetota bacterium]
MCKILDVEITDITRREAIDLLDEMIDQYDGRSRCVFFANAHTLNLAASDNEYRDVINSADHVLGDGTGIRWASKINGTPVKDNVNGTDLLPEFFHATAGRRYYLLGANVPTIRQAAAKARENFPDARQVGHHHGYVNGAEASARVIEEINAARPHILLVGMGNPLQEQWIIAHRHELKVPVIIGVGGLFDFWAGTFRRAPRWLRRLGHEWIWRLSKQPADKARRYLVGNPLFLYRVLRRKFARRVAKA